jgi:hypothetical protein
VAQEISPAVSDRWEEHQGSSFAGVPDFECDTDSIAGSVIREVTEWLASSAAYRAELETLAGVRKTLEILQSIIANAGDLIESRSPELVAAARAALTRYHDEALGQAE